MSKDPSRDQQILSHRTSAPWRSALCLALDAALVILFAAMGNRSHDSGLGAPEIWSTAWPFLLGLAVSWLLTFSWGNPHRIWPTGVFVVIGTVTLGMMFRSSLTDGGVQLSFVLVASAALAVLLLGRRLVSGRLVNGRASS